MDWCIHYADGSLFSDDDGPPQDAPGRGVVVIAQRDAEVGRALVLRVDYFWWQDGQWSGGDLFGLYDYLLEPGWKTVKMGRTVPATIYRQLVDRAQALPGLPIKSARKPGERL